MSATNRSKTARVREVTAGTTPATPAFKEVRVTSNGMNYDPSRVISAEIRSDRQVTDWVLTDLKAAGQLGIELSLNTYDDEFEEALQGTWSNNPAITVATVDTEISDVTATTLTVASGGAAFVTGMLTYMSGFTTPANNILARVTSSTGTSIVYPAATFTIEAAQIPVGASVRVVGCQGASADLVATVTGGNGITSTVLNFTTLGISVGEWVKVGGDGAGNSFATAGCNGWARVSDVAATRLSFDIAPAGWVADTGTGKTVQIFFGDFLTNGVTQRSVTIERQQQDLAAPSFEYFRGQQIDGLSWSLKSGAIITGSIDYVGLTASAPATVRFTGATDVAAGTNPVLNAASNVGRLSEGGVLVGAPSYVTEIGFNLKNNLEGRPAVGVTGSTSVRNGEIGISGTLNAYLGDTVLLGKVVNDTETSVMFGLGRTDGVRASLVVDIPRAKLNGTAPVPGKNASRMFNGTYQALRHATLGYTVSFGRFWYLPAA